MVRRIAHYLLNVLTLGFVARRWRVPCFLALGVFGGLGLSVAHISRATSYLSDDPETCINCHVMNPHYATWQHSSHASVANCNDCHVPHDNFVNHYFFKAKDGMRHSAIFTMRGEPQVIRLSAAAIPVVEDNCRRCHSNMIDDVHLKTYEAGDLRCWDCHRDVPHGRARSLSATPSVMRPALPYIGFDNKKPTIGDRPPRPTTRNTP